MSEEVGSGVPDRADSQTKAEKKRRKLMPRDGKRSKETGEGEQVSWAVDSATLEPWPLQQSSELQFNHSGSRLCARARGCLSAQGLVWPASVGVFSCTRQPSLHLLDACWLAGAKREWPGAREEGGGGSRAAEKELTTANRATANLGLRLHLGFPQVLCSPPRSSVHS